MDWWLVRQVGVGLALVVDADRRVLAHNAPFARTISRLFARDLTEDETLVSVMPAGNEAALAALLARLEGTEPFLSDLAVQTEEERFVLEVAASPLGEGRWLLLGRDVTQARRELAASRDMMNRLVTVDRMSAIGTLAAGVAHELNNPLTYVSAHLEHLASSVTSPELRDSIEDARQGVRRMAAIVRDLVSFARADDDRGSVDVESSLEFALKMADRALRAKASVIREYAAGGCVRINEARLGQVFLNLLINAAQAFETQRDGNEVRVRLARDGDRVIVDVIDNGPGMSEEIAARVFDAFFTTKPRGVGTGLGLFICQSVIRAAGGAIEIDSAPGRGARVRVSLPAIAESAPRAPSVRPSQLRRRILLVDDDERVSTALHLMLKRWHDITFARDGASALDQVSRAEFELVITDMIMPEMNGLELARQIRQRARHLRIALMTGGALDAGQERLARELDVELLQKPFRVSDVNKLFER